MSTEVTKRKRASALDKNKSQSLDGDHRKRRRNRTTQSCLNCHTSKRMCDRKRPACARCTQLGLTGLCVYEVDDPNQRPDTQDESSRLLKRIAELEGVVRELKNKPHPRWASSAGEQIGDESTLFADHPSTSCSTTMQESPTTPFLRSISPSQATSSAGSVVSVASPMSSPPPTTPPSSDIPSPNVMVNDDSSGLSYGMGPVLDPIFSPLHRISRYEECINKHSQLGDFQPAKSIYVEQHCDCVLDPSNYHTMLELSLRLRKASAMLTQSHQGGSSCHLNQKLAELDILTTDALSSVDSPHLHRPSRPSITQSSTISTLYPFADSAPRLENWLFGAITGTDAGSDPFMSWEPPKRPV